MTPEKLQPLEKVPFWLKPLKEEDKPHYTPAQKQLIAFSIAFEGTLSITRKVPHYYEAKIAIRNTEFDLLQNFLNIVRLGYISKSTIKVKGTQPQKEWKIVSYQEMFYILEQLKGYMPCVKYRKLRELVSEFCKRRIEAHEKHTRKVPFTRREHEIVKEVQKLNKRGL